MLSEVGSAECFEMFVATHEPRLRRAFAGCRSPEDAHEAVAEALAFAWENWERVSEMENPAGYLFRVGQSRTRRLAPRRVSLPTPVELGLPEVEPALVPALLELSEAQRTAVWLVHGCQWRYGEAAEAMGMSTSAIGTHVSRALARLRSLLEVDSARCD